MARVLERAAPVGVVVTTRPQRRDWSGFTAHAILIASVAVIAFPLYYALVISTQTVSQATSLPPPFFGSHSHCNFPQALGSYASSGPVGTNETSENSGRSL